MAVFIAVGWVSDQRERGTRLGCDLAYDVATRSPRLIKTRVVGRQRQSESCCRLFDFRRYLANLLAEHSGIVPAEAEFGIRGVTTERAKHFAAVIVVEQKDVTLFAFDEGQYIYVL